MALKSRKEMNPDYMWDFSHIFKTYEDWEAAYNAVQARVSEPAAFAGRLGEGASVMKEALDTFFEISYKIELVYLYAMLHKSSDNGDPKYQEMNGRVMNLFVAFSSSTAFFSPEVVALPKEVIDSYLADESLALYRHFLEDTARMAPHTLDASKEMMLAKLSDAANTPSNAFKMLESVDMTFPTMKDENGEEVAITHGNFGVFRESKDPEIRRESFEKYFGEFNKYINTFAALYAGSVKFDNFFADMRGYSSACEEALFGGNIPLSVYDKLVESIHGGLDTMKKYLALRKKVLGLETLNMYDLYCPMVESVDFKVTFEEAKVMVKNALAPLGEDYAGFLDEAYANKWMDVYENKGKNTGAFSCGVYGVHPYVLLNYTDSLDDAFTMAHELGHAMHSHLSNKTQEYVNHGYRIMVAEVASTVNEVLLTKYLLKTETDKQRKMYILNHFLEGFRTTVFRQTLFAEFERKAHEALAAGTPLTAEVLNKIYRDLNELYYQGALVNELQDIEWARIPHFYNSFYVYQYATGFCSAVAIANKIYETGDASDYLKFLTLGGSDYPIEELKTAGIDLTTPDTVNSALKVFADTLDEMEKLILE